MPKEQQIKIEGVSENTHLFDSSNFKFIKAKVIHVLSVDTLDERHLTYILARKIGNTVDILLTKQMDDKVQFETEVRNLAKYFNATILR